MNAPLFMRIASTIDSNIFPYDEMKLVCTHAESVTRALTFSLAQLNV